MQQRKLSILCSFSLNLIVETNVMTKTETGVSCLYDAVQCTVQLGTVSLSFGQHCSRSPDSWITWIGILRDCSIAPDTWIISEYLRITAALLILGLYRNTLGLQQPPPHTWGLNCIGQRML